jgi:cobalt/nickel transport system permease protein
MHMSDALISVAVGGTMLAASGGAAVYSVKKIQICSITSGTEE